MAFLCKLLVVGGWGAFIRAVLFVVAVIIANDQDHWWVRVFTNTLIISVNHFISFAHNCCLLRTLSAHHRNEGRLPTVLIHTSCRGAESSHASHSSLSRAVHIVSFFITSAKSRLFVYIWLGPVDTLLTAQNERKSIAKQNTLDSISSFAWKCGEKRRKLKECVCSSGRSLSRQCEGRK